MDLHLEGKVIFVTGGFKGIGKGISLQLAREGAIPVVLNRKDGVEDEFRKEISEITDTFEMYYIDLNDTDAIKPIVEEVYKKYGHIDGVVNNAGRN
ncbi:SDR family NAD(P)-dependent oxidoreductase, partial [uncultured Parolsenella sp.]